MVRLKHFQSVILVKCNEVHSNDINVISMDRFDKRNTSIDFDLEIEKYDLGSSQFVDCKMYYPNRLDFASPALPERTEMPEFKVETGEGGKRKRWIHDDIISPLCLF